MSLSMVHWCWSVSILLLSCIPAVGCGDPGSPTNGQRSLSSTTYNSVVTYTCDVGYTLQGSNSRTCQSSGLWSGSVPQCTRMLSSIPIVFSPGVHKSTIIVPILYPIAMAMGWLSMGYICDIRVIIWWFTNNQRISQIYAQRLIDYPITHGQ